MCQRIGYVEMKLNLGGGGTRIEGYVSVDIDISTKPDLVADITELSLRCNSYSSRSSTLLLARPRTRFSIRINFACIRPCSRYYRRGLDMAFGSAFFDSLFGACVLENSASSG